MGTFHSSGKLLLTGEYVVLDGANALALPTVFGQSLTIKSIDEQKLIWTSFDETKTLWFKAEFSFSEVEIICSTTSDEAISNWLVTILNVAKSLNPEFLSSKHGFEVSSFLEFPRNWGLGSSSTLLNNIAQWSNVNPFKLSDASFGGSGYDIACASSKTPIHYSVSEEKRTTTPISFEKSFEKELFFVHLNEKQNSRDAIKMYEKNKQNCSKTISEVNKITLEITKTNSLTTFEQLLNEHELLIAEITKQIPVKERLFSDYKHSIKSLGAWGGDFILATGHRAYVETYFKIKGYSTILPFKEMVL